jgi:hypothetical protein
MTKLEELRKAWFDAENAITAGVDYKATLEHADYVWSAYYKEISKQKEITMYAPELNIDISGWYEAEDGVGFVEIGEALDVNDLANKLLDKYGDDIIGVDMELEGQYCDGSPVYDAAIMLELTRIGG